MIILMLGPRKSKTSIEILIIDKNFTTNIRSTLGKYLSKESLENIGTKLKQNLDLKSKIVIF